MIKSRGNTKDPHIKNVIEVVRNRKNIPVVFHAFQNYDSNYTFQAVGKYDFQINVILNTIEKYIWSNPIEQPSKKGIKQPFLLLFIVSIHFLKNSLDNSVKNLERMIFII